MNMKKRHWATVVSLVLLNIAICIAPAQAVENNLKFSGQLVSEPCDLDPNTTDITVPFGTIIEKDLYLHTRTKGKPFTINLINCDISLGKTVTLKFAGVENSALPGYLAIDGTATGVAIGMESEHGTPLPFNQPTPDISLITGTSSFTLLAFVIGEPQAIQNQSITPGDFTATATFELMYP
jgi:type 1 fimbria pilin